MAYGTVKMARPGSSAAVLVCDWCGAVLDGIGVEGREIIRQGGNFYCSTKCAGRGAKGAKA